MLFNIKNKIIFMVGAFFRQYISPSCKGLQVKRRSVQYLNNEGFSLKAMTTDELVKLLMSPEMARLMNEPIRQQIIKILQEREGNAFCPAPIGKVRWKEIDG
jgi:hypothetical protein